MNDHSQPRATERVFHIELDLSLDYRNSHEPFVILNALEEYANTERWRAEDDTTMHGDYLRALAETADALRERIEAQMCDANVVERRAS